MATPQTAEFLSFRRTFTLLILLVVLPSAGLSGFGVVAIINERAAVEKRLTATWSGRLTTVWADVKSRLDTVTVASESPLQVMSSEIALVESTFDVDDGGVIAQDGALEPVVKILLPQFSVVPQKPVVFSASTPQGVFLLVARRTNGSVHGGFVSQTAMERLVREVGAPLLAGGEPAQLALLPVKPVPAEGVLARLASGVTEAREAALAPPELASLALPSPFQDYRLVAQAVGEDPVGKASARNRTVYGVLLGIFYVTLALGVLFTGRTLYREAQLSRLKTDFVSLVSHELRTPLHAMLGFGRVLDKGAYGPLTTKQRQYLGHMLEAAEHMGRLVEALLDLRRHEDSPDPMPTTPVSVAECLARARVLAGPLLDERGHAVTEDVPASLPRVMADHDALVQVLVNLLSNAARYTPPGGHVAVRASCDATQGTVSVSVEDDGIGIAPEHRERVFDYLAQVQGPEAAALRGTQRGTGLGLAIARAMLRRMQGAIDHRPNPVGKGSVFTVTLRAEA